MLPRWLSAAAAVAAAAVVLPVAAYPTKEEWASCKECTGIKQRVFCYTTMECFDGHTVAETDSNGKVIPGKENAITLPDMHVDTPTPEIWDQCMNPLLHPASCRTKGIYPPGSPQAETWRREHDIPRWEGPELMDDKGEFARKLKAHLAAQAAAGTADVKTEL